MNTVALESDPDLAALVARANAGEEIVITDHDKPVAKVVAVAPGPRRATEEMIERRMKALDEVQKLNPYRDIVDVVAWQREIRKDRPLPGRD